MRKVVLRHYLLSEMNLIEAVADEIVYFELHQQRANLVMFVLN